MICKDLDSFLLAVINLLFSYIYRMALFSDLVNKGIKSTCLWVAYSILQCVAVFDLQAFSTCRSSFGVNPLYISDKVEKSETVKLFCH